MTKSSDILSWSFQAAFHVPKMPALVCLIDDEAKRPAGVERSFCDSLPVSIDQLCLSYLDVYPMAIRLLRELYVRPYRLWLIRLPERRATIANMQRAHLEHLQILAEMEKEYDKYDVLLLPCIASLIEDLARLNSTLVCG